MILINLIAYHLMGVSVTKYLKGLSAVNYKLNNLLYINKVCVIFHYTF